MGMAFWYADDGSLQESDVRSPVCSLHTNGFDTDDVLRVIDHLCSRGYESYLVGADNYPVIKFTPDGTRRLHLDIAPYTPWGTRYKLIPELRNVTPIWEQSEIASIESQNLIRTEIVDISHDYALGNRSKIRYDIEVEGNHNFFANGILVHNSGIQRRYGLDEKRFSLFNVGRWGDKEEVDDQGRIKLRVTNRPFCCHVVPVLAELDSFDTAAIKGTLLALESRGSSAAPGFMDPEGIVCYHKHSNSLFKATVKNDDKGKEYGG
jgi:hypothetical protein